MLDDDKTPYGIRKYFSIPNHDTGICNQTDYGQKLEKR